MSEIEESPDGGQLIGLMRDDGQQGCFFRLLVTEFAADVGMESVQVFRIREVGALVDESFEQLPRVGPTLVVHHVADAGE